MTSTAVPVPKPVRRNRSRRRWTGWLFTGPFMIVFTFTLAVPLAYAAYLSLFQDRLVGGNSFVGIANYRQAIHDPQFWQAFERVAVFLVVQVPIMLLLALCAALALDSARLRWAPLYRLSVFLPYAVPAVVAALMWGFMYGKHFGLVANIDKAFNVQIPDPFSSGLVLTAIGNIVTWEYVGYNMLIFFSALRVIPNDLYEAAELDGATGFQVVRAIKLPALRNAILVATIFSVIGSFQLFNEPNILKSLSPNTIGSYFTPNMYAYNLSFAGQQYNYSATVAIVMGVITVIIAYAVQLSARQKEA